MANKKEETPQQAVAETQEPIHQEPRVLTMGDPVGTLVPASPPSPDEVLAMADNQIKIRKGYVKLVSRFLRPEDVLVFGEEVYLPARPCQDILSWARIRVKPHWPVEEHRYSSPDGEFIEFVITATITDSGGREVDVMGNRSTRDEFFGISGKEYVCPTCKGPTVRRKAYPSDKWDSNFCDQGNHGKVKAEAVVHYLPLCDVDIPSVRSAAVTNLWNKALKAIGLMPTIQDLGEAGMDINKVKRVDFKSDGKQKAAPPQQAQPKPAATQSNQTAVPASKPNQNMGAPSTAPPPTSSVLPRANIPPFRPLPPRKEVSEPGTEQTLKGILEKVSSGTTVPKDKATGERTGGKGRPFLGLIINGGKFTCFDNQQLAVDVRGKKSHAFILLGQSVGKPVVLKVKQAGKFTNVTGFVRIGDMEWDEAGVPILRREAPPQESVTGDEGEYVATDDDFPAAMFPPGREDDIPF